MRSSPPHEPRSEVTSSMDNHIPLPDTLQRRTILALNDLGQAVTASLRLDEVFARALNEVMTLLESDGAAILMPEGDRLHFVAVSGPGAAQLRGLRIPGHSGLGSYVMRTGEAVWLNDRGSSVPGITVNPQTEKLGGFHAGSLLAAPLNHGSRTLGVLMAAHRDVDGLLADDLPVLAAAANWVSIAISNAKLHEQAQEAREQRALLEERNRLARELHDAVTQSLYSISTLAGAWRRQIDAGHLQPQKEQIAELGELAQQALREVRLLIYELRPTELEEEGLVGALFRRLETVEQRTGIHIRLLISDDAGQPHPVASEGRQGMVDFYRLPTPVEHGLYRIAQEALNNALKHSHATAVTVSILLGRSTLSLEVKDNGRGFDAPQAQQTTVGFGLSSMNERAENLGGRLVVLSSPEGGTCVRVEGVPYRFVDAEEMIG
jgi:signal transduction histidine kinase